MEMAATGDPIDAQRAYALGFVIAWRASRKR